MAGKNLVKLKDETEKNIHMYIHKRPAIHALTLIILKFWTKILLIIFKTNLKLIKSFWVTFFFFFDKNIFEEFISLELDIAISQTTKDVFVGQSVGFEIQIKNQSVEDLSVTIKLGSQLIEYTGEVLRNLNSNKTTPEKSKFRKAQVSHFYYFIHVYSSHLILLQ